MIFKKHFTHRLITTHDRTLSAQNTFGLLAQGYCEREDDI